MRDGNEPRKRSGFNYARYFGDITVLNNLQMRPEDREWLTKPPRDPRPVDTILYLGCNVLRTPHLVRTVTDIFRLLDVDFALVGGTTYCCGIIHFREGDTEAGLSMGRQTLEYFTRFQASTVVSWCPSCIYNYDEMMQMPSPIPLVHTSQFLAGRLDRLRPLLQRPVPRRVALHAHTGSAQTDREAECTRALLAAIPGIELVDLDIEPGLGRRCSFGSRNLDGWGGLVTPLVQQAVDRGADTLGTIYHGCQGSLCFHEAAYPLSVDHYIALLGMSMGIEYPDLYKKYALLGDEEAILAEATPCMEVNKQPLERARDTIRRSFTS